jgi:hypothetical protein
MLSIAAPSSIDEVQFDNDEKRNYVRVANLDTSRAIFQGQILEFLRVCNRVRVHEESGRRGLDSYLRLEAVENGLFPETSGTFKLSARDEKEAERWHGLVFSALASRLKEQGHSVTNARIRRWGPDLYTNDRQPQLFEIKTSVSAAAIQQGVGQLLLYEKALGRLYRKTLVVPHDLSELMMSHLKQLSINVLTFTRVGSVITFR